MKFAEALNLPFEAPSHSEYDGDIRPAIICCRRSAAPYAFVWVGEHHVYYSAAVGGAVFASGSGYYLDSYYMRRRRRAQHLHGCIESDHGVASIDENAGSTFAENRNAAVGYVEQGHQSQQLEAVVGL